MVLAHPMLEEGSTFLPCCYGYGSTIRRSQGADLDLGCIYFDQKMTAGRVYGYVAASRFKSRAGCYLYGKMRRTDFLPVGEEQPDEVLERGFESESSDEDDGCRLEYAFPEEDSCCSEAGDPDGPSGHCLVDFIQVCLFMIVRAGAVCCRKDFFCWEYGWALRCGICLISVAGVLVYVCTGRCVFILMSPGRRLIHTCHV